MFTVFRAYKMVSEEHYTIGGHDCPSLYYIDKAKAQNIHFFWTACISASFLNPI